MLLFEGCFYSRGASILGVLLFEGCYYSRGAFIRGVSLFEGCFYSIGVLLFEAWFYSRGATIRGVLLFELCSSNKPLIFNIVNALLFTFPEKARARSGKVNNKIFNVSGISRF